MSKLIACCKFALTDKSGISAMEYAALAAVIVIGISTAATPLKTALTTGLAAIGAVL